MHYPGSACRGTDLPSDRLLYLHITITIIIITTTTIIIIINTIIITIIIIVIIIIYNLCSIPAEGRRTDGNFNNFLAKIRFSKF